MISERFDGEVVSWNKDTGGRVVSLLLDLGNTRVNLINIYAPANLTERKVFFDKLHEFFIPADGLIIGGDFNSYEHELDKFGGNFSGAPYLKDFRAAFKLCDIWRKHHPKSSQMSWFNADLSIGSRLDKFFISEHLVNYATHSEISPCCLSDHDYVNLEFVFDNLIPRGPGIWKFNNSLLDDEGLCDYLTGRISDLSLCKTRFDSITTWWDFFKASLRGDIIAFARERRRRLHRERISLTNRIISLKRQLVQGFSPVSHEILFLESRLAALTDRMLEGVKTRSRAQWLEQGEKPSRYFFKLEKERMAKSEVKSILNSDGIEVTSRDALEAAHVDFYSKLFAAEAIDLPCQRTLFAALDKQLSDPDRVACEGILSQAELTASLKTLNTDKAPGPDGFTAEFYAKFWNLLGPLVTEVINTCFEGGSLSETMKTSVTRLIYKKRGDIKDLKNWRPISLLNVDYKICSKAITMRLSKVLDSIIHPDQTCSVPGRSISNNTCLLRDVLDFIDQTNETGILVSLDQEKAFDRVHRGFLMALLKRLGFGPDFCRWIDTFYAGANMRIILNGWLTKPIWLHRGVRQGDSLSPLLYVICVEVLACQIRSAQGVRGFLLPGAGGNCFKVRQYADDTTSFVKDYSSLVCLFEQITVYEKGSGAKLNRSKTEAMWLGAWRSRTDEPLGLTWVRKMKVLGVFFGTVPVEQDNWQIRINKLEKSLNLWKSRSLSLVGKSLIINVLGLSKFFYVAKVLVPPSWVFSRVNQLVWPFLWGSKIETVSRNTCHLPHRLGGLHVSNLELKCAALRLSTVLTLVSEPEDSSYFLCRYFVGGRLAPLRPEWRCLRDNTSPSAATPSTHYMKCLSDLEKVNLRAADVIRTTKTIYLHLLKDRSSPPILSPAWTPFIGPGLIMKDHWARVRDPLTENFKNDLSWLITLRAVKVRDSLKNWGYIDSNRCAVCQRKETIDHCFLNCRRAKNVWAHFAASLSALVGGPFLASILTVFFFRWQSGDRRRDRIAIYLVKSILYAIWAFRNKATFYNGNESSRAIIKYALHDVHSRIRLDFARLPPARFQETWVTPAVCFVSADGLTVFLK